MPDPALEPYFAEAASWDADRAAQSRRSLRIAWSVAGVGWLAVLMASGALMMLMPLKRIEPFVIRVDNTTGVVDVVPVYAAQVPMGQAVTRYLLSHYVSVCERFNFATAESDYEECGAFHTAQRNQVWSAAWAQTNPASPLNHYKDGTTVRAQVSSISFFERGTGVSDLAQVRYLKAQRTADGADEQITHWIATIQYAYTQVSTDPKIRRWNPLGFKIVEFKPEPEVLPDAPASSSGAGGSSGSEGRTP